MEYLEWNDLIAGHFFKPSMAGRRVHLFVTKELITELGGTRGASFDEFIQSVKAGPSWSRGARGLCQKALESLHQWRARGLDYPPYISYLALFVSAAALEADFAPHAYYPRLRTLLGQEPVTGQLPSFTSMVELWDDLERWSEEDRRGDVGRFHHDFFGEWMHCGLPMAQALLSDDERRGLASVFAEAGLEPDAPPPAEELAIALLRHGHSLLRRRTLEILKRSDGGSEFRSALLEAVVAELREWDGTLAESRDSEGEDEVDGAFSYGAVRLCCAMDRTAACVRMYLRCKTRGEFPEDGLQLEHSGVAGRLLAEEWGAGWSEAITDQDGKEVDAEQFDWSQPLMFEDAAQAWRLRMPASPVRILVAGEREGLPDLVEVRRLPEGAPFTVAVRADLAQTVSAWATSACEHWQEVRLQKGLPRGWRLFGADRAHGQAGGVAPLPLLSLPAKTGLSLRGGIRVSPHSSHYFYFAPPDIELEGAAADTSVYCARQDLKPRSDGLYAVPAALLAAAEDGKISIEARAAGAVVAKVSFSIARQSVAWSSGAPPRVSGTPRAETATNTPMIRGAATSGLPVPAFSFDGVVPLLARGTVRYVGREPGQIAPSLEERGGDWAPIWVVQTRRKGSALFCGSALDEATPVLGPCGNPRKLREWKELLWIRRRDIAPPTHPRLRELWREYQEAARRA